MLRNTGRVHRLLNVGRVLNEVLSLNAQESVTGELHVDLGHSSMKS